MSVLARSIPCFSSRASFLAALSSDQQQQKNNFNCQRNTVFNEEHNYVKIEGFLSYEKKVLLSPSFYFHINILKKRLKEFTWIIISPFADDLMVFSIWDWDKPLAAVSWVSNSRLWFCKQYVFLKTTTTLYRKKEKMQKNCHVKRVEFDNQWGIKFELVEFECQQIDFEFDCWWVVEFDCHSDVEFGC